MRRLGLLIFVLSLFAVPATASAAVAGGLKQFPGGAGCFSDDAPVATGCSHARAIAGVGDVVVSPDGKNVYVSSTTKNAIAIFDRNAATGRLTQKGGVLGCITVTAGTVTSDGCNLLASDATSLTNPTGLAVSPDGKNVYVVTNQGRVSAFNRAADGTLSFNNFSNLCGDGCPLTSVAVSPDGFSVYPVGTGDSGIVAIYRRSLTAGPGLGSLSFRTCFSPSTCGTSASNLGTVSDVIVTPDNKQVLLAVQNQNAMLAWDRITSGVNQGDVTPGAAANHCISAGSLANCTTRQGIITPQGLATADGGSRILISAQQALATVNRNASTGAITAPTNNCFGYPGSNFAGCTPLSATTGCCTIFYPSRDVAVTPDSKQAYVGTESPNASLFDFNRTNGTLSTVPGPLRCITVGGIDGCTTFRGGNRVQELFAAPGSQHVYGGGDNRLWGFAVDRPPVCSNVSASTSNSAAVRVTFNCSDPDGDAVTFQKVSDPGRGALAAVSGNGVNYVPFPGTSGTDSFKFRAVAGGVASDPATAFVNVSAPPPPPPPPPPALTTLTSTTSINSLAFPKFTKLLALSAKNLPANSKVVVTCKTKKKKQQKKGCPYKKKTFKSAKKKSKLDLRKRFKKKKLPVGTKVGITITANGFLGKRITYTIRKGKLPKSKVQCLTASGRVGKCR